jgi:hypothetical protein
MTWYWALIIRIAIPIAGFIISYPALKQLREQRTTMSGIGCASWCTCVRCSNGGGSGSNGGGSGGGGGGAAASGSLSGGSGSFANGGGWTSSGAVVSSSGVAAGAGGSGGAVVSSSGLSRGRGSGGGMPGFTEVGADEFAFAAGSVLGLRQWTLARPDFRGDPHNAATDWPVTALHGATGYAWPPGTLEGALEGTLEARCNNNYPHPPPVDYDPSTGARCGCGFWAYWDMGSLAASHPISPSSSSLPVLGIIEGYGRVLLGECGFRSQKAKIVALAPAFAIQAELPPPRAPAFAIQAELPPPRHALPGTPAPLSPDSDDPYLAYAQQRKTQERAQQHADAWMAMTQDRLGQLYPQAAVYATVDGLLASVQTRGKP